MTKSKSKIILGISAFYHDSAAALVIDGNIIAAAQEERFSRKKHDPSFPVQAINYCLEEAKISLEDIDHIVFYEKPFLKFERLLETYLSLVPYGFQSFRKAIPVWIKEKLFQKSLIKRELSQFGKLQASLNFSSHHYSHAASAFFASPFSEAHVLCMDGVGEWATTSLWHGKENNLKLLKEIHFPHSLGLLYSSFTYYIGFKVNSGEYKLMGLAPYGEDRYSQIIKDHLVQIAEDGSFKLNMKYFDFATGLKMTNSHFHQLFSREPRLPETQIDQFHMDIAKSIQVVTEEILLKLCRSIRKTYGADRLCLAGGVALNCVANGKIMKESIFKDVWIQPAAGDAGGALGAALGYWYEGLGNTRKANARDSMRGGYLGPKYSNEQIQACISSLSLVAHRIDDTCELLKLAAANLSEGQVGGLFQGRMEFGPRSLGARSIIADPRSIKMQSTLNLKIKYRESFRPFAPAILEEFVEDWFDLNGTSPYMLAVADIRDEHKSPLPKNYQDLYGVDKLKVPRSSIPAVTHLDYSARIQTVSKQTNPFFHQLIDKFREITGTPILVNTSFNVRGEPIVESPIDALRCFLNTEMDFLIMENFILKKSDQPKDIQLNKPEFLELD